MLFSAYYHCNVYKFLFYNEIFKTTIKKNQQKHIMKECVKNAQQKRSSLTSYRKNSILPKAGRITSYSSFLVEYSPPSNVLKKLYEAIIILITAMAVIKQLLF